MSHCTGPYTRVPFTSKELKPIQKLLRELGDLEVSQGTGAFVVQECPSGQGGTDDFNLHIDIRGTAEPHYIWDIRAAKFKGPKKTFGQSHVYEIAVRKRDAHNTVVWEGYVFAGKFETLAKRLPADLKHLMDSASVQDWLPSDEAQVKRIQLCTGT